MWRFSCEYSHLRGYILSTCNIALKMWILTKSSSNNIFLDIYKILFITRNYGCSFVAKLSWKNTFFFEKMFFTKYALSAEKKILWKKKVLYWKNFLLKKTFFSKKNISENVKNYISKLRNIFLCRKCLYYK